MPAWPRIGWPAIAGGVAALALAWSAATHSASFAFQASNPELALRIAPSNPVALVHAAQQSIALGAAGGAGGPSIIRAAERSIREQPLNAAAFRLYGLVRTANSDLDAIGAQVAMADRLSRRDLAAQLFLIEYAVRRNDIAAALRHYDTALRVEESSGALLYPVLTAAMSEPLIRQRFRPYLAARPPWLESFLRQAVSTSKNPAEIAALAMEAGGFPSSDEYSSLDTELLVALEAAEQFPALVRYYGSLDHADRSLLTTLAFTEANTRRSLAPVSWLPYAIEGIDSVFVTTAEGQLELEAELDSGFAGPVARKLTALPAGIYRLSAAMRAEAFQPDDNIRWQIVCAKSGTETGRELLNQTVEMAARFAFGGQFTVPAGCPVQRIEIFGQTGFGIDAATVSIASPSLKRL